MTYLSRLRLQNSWRVLLGLAVFLPLAGAQSVAIVNVNVVDVGRGRVLPHMTVIVDGGKIVRVGATASTKAPKDAQAVAGEGKFLIPGLWDMHVHTFFGDTGAKARDVTIPLYVANGITGVRDMGSDLDAVLQARKDIAEHRLIGPRMIVAGPMLDGPKPGYPASLPVAPAEEGRRAVTMLKSRGVDFIKIQSGVPREAYFAIAEQCRRENIPFSGHVPDAVRGAEASNAGMRSFEHLIGIFEGSSPAEDEFLKGPKGPGRFLETYDAAREAALIRLLKKNGTWQCPTLYWERGQWLVDAIDVSGDPAAKLVPASWPETIWPKWKESILKTLDTDPLPVRQRFVEHELGIVKRLHAAGVPFLAGTDTPAGVDVIPGVSLHRELQRFVDAGFTPLEALRTATVNPARFLGRTAEWGTIAAGKAADLVLLDGNPLVDIRNTEKIVGVMLAGRYLSHKRITETH